MSKDNWWKDASYVVSMTPTEISKTYGSRSRITFNFPNANAIKKDGLTFETELYHFNTENEVLHKNLAAEMLQCYIDRERDASSGNPS